MNCAALFAAGCTPAGESVVVYTSQDQVYSEAILQRFERDTGIRVRAVYDSEAVKTVGLANRLLAERARPRCDVFWSNEELRTRRLAADNVFREEDGWTAFGHRSRRIVINTNLISLAEAPRSMIELTNTVWRRKVALAYPLFGTTATHFLALRQAWGHETWKEWCRTLEANKPFLVDGNSVVVQLVGRGEAPVGLTDSDDVAAAQREGFPVVALPLTPDMLLIPNTVAVIRGSPNPEAAQQLYEYLQRPDIVQVLVAANALEGADEGEVEAPTLQADLDIVAANLDAGIAALKEIFFR